MGERGQVVARLLRALPKDIAVGDDLVDKGRVLDGFYIPARYPNGFPKGAPFEHFGPLQSDEAIGYAREIIDFARDHMAR